ncbi:AbfB domain-containing protein [Catellatospora sp. KI3]|uniref:AbfB domain-containing protein n=1 Tax=Catellatospora sp. KI3 TaxID=3041620 RepID=UPI00248252D7|nr:AbfB domain-containing protein [Catellatospora sp. KI3]MDI1463721.1 AbfB domain-containing protein [Catellatospora sp. KI3]
MLRRTFAALSAATAVLALLAVPAPAGAATGTPVSPDAAMYPRALRLAYNGTANGRILLTTTAFPGGGPVGAISESTDGGATYHRVGTVADPAARAGLCCTTVFELPQQLGSLPAGTLLWAGAVGQDAADRRMALRVWRSSDLGRTWTHLSTAVTSATTGGLWEPEFSLDATGRLVLHFADESQAGHSQLLARVVTTDGYQWGQRTWTVTGTAAGHRPGMPAVRRLPGGTYLLAYEVCGYGGQYDCAVRYRTSADGWSWGDPADLGPLARTADGRYLVATPTLALTSTGRILLIGQRLLNANGSTAALNGTAALTAGAALDTWSLVPVPVGVPGAALGVCPNYSPTLVPLDGAGFAQVSTDVGADGTCRAYAAAALLPPPVAQTTALTAVGGTCVDAAAGGAANGAAVQLWSCNNGPVQRWTWRPDGSLSVNGRCLDVPGAATANGTPLQIWDCNGAPNQQWLRRPDGTLVNPRTGRCLDSPGGATGNGTRLQLWDCNGTAAQRVTPTSPALPFKAGDRISLRAVSPGYADRRLRHQNGLTTIAPISTGSPQPDRGDATFVVRPGLADATCFSFEAVAPANNFLRHADYRVRLSVDDGSALLRADATFCGAAGDLGQVVLRSSNFPDRLIRHYSAQVYIAVAGGPQPFDAAAGFAADSTWAVEPALL